jgi:putative acetyltransferase
MDIIENDLNSFDVQMLLQQHLDSMAEVSPPDSMHALGSDGLQQADVTFWTLRDSGELLGCGGLKEIDPRHGEVKSMRTVERHLGKGVASRILAHIIQEARARDYSRLSLETGSMESFSPAHALYLKFRFLDCEPFGEYVPDPYSRFFTLKL